MTCLLVYGNALIFSMNGLICWGIVRGHHTPESDLYK